MKRKIISVILVAAFMLSMLSITSFAGQEVTYRDINYSTQLTIGTASSGTMTFLTPDCIADGSTGAAKGFTVELEKDKEYLFSFKANTNVAAPHVINIMVLNNVMQGVFSKDILSTSAILHEMGTVAATAVRFKAPSNGAFRVLITEGSMLVDDYVLVDVDYSVRVDEMKWLEYSISNASELSSLRDSINNFSVLSAQVSVKLKNDIDMGNANWRGFKCFAGIFDGNGKTISNFGMGTENINYSGVLGKVMTNADVKNVNIENVFVTGAMYTGALAGKAENSKISGCTATGEARGAGLTGGLIGEVSNCEVDNCSADMKVSGGIQSGCLFGAVDFGSTVKECSAKGSVSGADNVGGFAGTISTNAVVEDSKAECTVSGMNDVGVFVGNAITTVTLRRNAALGSVSGNTAVGGFAGEATAAVIIDECFTEATVKGYSYLGGFVGSVGLNVNFSDCFSKGAVSTKNNYSTNTIAGGFVGLICGNTNTFTNCYTISPLNVYSNKVGGFAGSTRTNIITGQASFQNCYTAGAITILNAAENYGSFIGNTYTGKIDSLISSASSCYVSTAQITRDSAKLDAPVCFGVTSDRLVITGVDFTDDSAVASLEDALNTMPSNNAAYCKWSGRNTANGPELQITVLGDNDDSFDDVIDWVKSQNILFQIPLWIFYVPVNYIISVFRNLF